MLAALLRRFAIDPVQWRALVVAGIRLDFRTPGLAEGGATGLKRFLAGQAIYLVLGVALAAMALFSPDVFVTGTICLTMTMFLVAASVLIEFAVVVISPMDYDVLGYQPVSSSTYFAARLANVLFYTAVTTTVTGIIPMGAYFFARGFNPVLGLAAVAAVYMAATTTTLAMIVAYVALARVVHPQRLRRVLTHVQLTLSFMVYGGYLVMPRLFNAQAMQHLTVEKSAWMLLYPPTWFASYLELAAGRRSVLEWLPAAASVAALLALARFAATRLSLGYSELLARQAAKSEGVQRRGQRSNLIGLGRNEHRAVALLLRAQFRHDQRFRFGVLSIVPLTAFYLFTGLREGPMTDPFVSAHNANSGMFLYFALLFIPMMLLVSVGRSDSFRAAWIFFVTPARRADLVLATKHLIFSYLLVPYLLVLGLVLTWFFGSALHAYLHVLVEALIANLFLLAVVAARPELPFSAPVQKGHATTRFFGIMLAGSIVQGLSAPLLAWLVYPYPAVLAAVVAALVGAGVYGERRLRRYVDRVADGMEFVM